jgi:hypothetical protein
MPASGHGFRDVGVPDASAGRSDINTERQVPNTFEAPWAEPAEAEVEAEANAFEEAANQPQAPEPASKSQQEEIVLEAEANAESPEPEELEEAPPMPPLIVKDRDYYDRLAGIDRRPYGRR